MNTNEDLHRDILRSNFQDLNDRNKETLLKIGMKFLDIHNLVGEENQNSTKRSLRANEGALKLEMASAP